MSAKVYLAYAIDQAVMDANLASEIEGWLHHRAEVTWIFEPGTAFSAGRAVGQDTSIREINSVALDHANVLVAVLPKGTISVGVPMEIDRAVRAGKPTLVISDAPSWMLKFTEPHVRVASEWGDEAKEWLSYAFLDISEPLPALRGTPLPVQMLGAGAGLPTFSYDDDAGLDLIVSADTTLDPGVFTDIPHEVAVELPPHTWGMITGRSSALRTHGLLLPFGVIDAGYRGPLFAGAWNLGPRPVYLQAGSRVAQLILINNETRHYRPVEADSLSESARGSNGFGSTGT